MDKYIPVAARLLLAQLFVVATVIQLMVFMNNPDGYEQFRVQLGMLGLPGVFAPLMILVQLVGGIALLLGFKTRLFAFVMAAYSVFMAFALGMSVMQWLAVAGGLLALAALSPTACSLDNLLKKK
ncbi:MAG TPA: DoxX family protein [Methylophilaceae bacterium]|jgi:putative oxidoreductase|nr:DoxX family protein [Methylophilaceae bacterium]